MDVKSELLECAGFAGLFIALIVVLSAVTYMSW
jgi:hypothetical protein